MKKMIIFSALFFALILFGCGVQEAQKSLEPVTLKLKWIHQAQFAGNYVAKEKGFYASEGLDVSLVPFSFEDPTIPAVISGKAQFGITGADELLVARANGAKIKAVAVIYNINPSCMYSLASSGITSPKQFIGKRIGIQKNTNGEVLYNVMLSKLGINKSLITEIEIGYDSAELLDNQVDVSIGYLINEPYQAILKGNDVNIIMMAEYGADSYGDVLFTTEELISSNPELVNKVTKATLKGWQYAIENVDEAVNITLAYSDSSREHQEYMLEKSVNLVNQGNALLGTMDTKKWQNIYSLLKKQGVITAELKVEEAYTNSFIG